MTSRIAQGSNRPNLALAAVVLLPVALVIVSSSRHGLGATADSVGYVAAARSFAATGAFTYWDGTPFAHWPPGLPLLLGTLLKVGIDPLASAFVLNLVAVVGLVALTYVVGRWVTTSWAAFVAAALVAVALSTVRVYSQLWTEPLFFAVCLATVWILTRIVRDGVTWPGVIAVVVCVSLACSLRYIGIALFPVVGISVLIAEAPRGLPRAVVIAGVTTALSGIGMAAIALRNLIVVDTLSGSSSKSDDTLPQVVRTIVAVIGQWVTADLRVPSVVAVLAGVAIITVGALGAFVLLRNVAMRRIAVPLIAFVVSYPLTLVVSSLLVNVDLDYRTVGPLLPPTTILIVAGLANIWSFINAASRRGQSASASGARALPAIAAAPFLVAIGLYLAVNLVASLSFTSQMARTGSGYNSDAKLSSPLALAAGDIPGTGTLLSNDPPRVYWVAGRSPVPGSAAVAELGDPARVVRAGIEAGTLTHYADFKDSSTLQGISAEKLRSWGVALGEPASYADGTLYRMTVAPVP